MKFFIAISCMLAGLLMPVISFSSMVAGTLVQTPEGLKAIETLKVGDQVMAYNEATRGIEAHPITFLYTQISKSVMALELVEDVPGIVTTEEHPFYVQRATEKSKKSYQWVPAKDLNKGDQLFTQNHELLQINRVTRTLPEQRVFNIEIATLHNYFVSDKKILVHNPGYHLNLDDTTECLGDVGDKRRLTIDSYKKPGPLGSIMYAPDVDKDSFIVDAHYFSQVRAFGPTNIARHQRTGRPYHIPFQAFADRINQHPNFINLKEKFGQETRVVCLSCDLASLGEYPDGAISGIDYLSKLLGGVRVFSGQGISYYRPAVAVRAFPDRPPVFAGYISKKAPPRPQVLTEIRAVNMTLSKGYGGRAYGGAQPADIHALDQGMIDAFLGNFYPENTLPYFESRGTGKQWKRSLDPFLRSTKPLVDVFEF